MRRQPDYWDESDLTKTRSEAKKRLTGLMRSEEWTKLEDYLTVERAIAAKRLETIDESQLKSYQAEIKTLDRLISLKRDVMLADKE